MFQILFLIFFKINSFYVSDTYWQSGLSSQLITICNTDVPNYVTTNGLAASTPTVAFFPTFTEANLINYEENYPLWVLLVIKAFENWSTASGGGISFQYFIENDSYCQCIEDHSSNICWSVADLLSSLIDVEKIISLNSLEEVDIILNSEENSGVIFFNGVKANNYDFLSVMNHAVGMFLGFEELNNNTTASVMGNVNSSNTDFRTLYPDDENGVSCLYPATGSAFTSHPACCSNVNPFLRPTACTDNLGFSGNGPFIGSEPGTGGGCASIKDESANDQNIFFLVYLLFFSSIFLFRLLFKKYLILIFIFYSFNMYSAFEDDLGLDDYDYKAIEQNMQNTKVEKKEYMSTKDIIDKEKADKENIKKKEEKVEADKVEGLVKNLDTQIKFKRFREKSPYFTNISFGVTYSTVSDFNKINSNFKEAGILGLKGFPYTYNFLLEFGIENILTQGLIFYVATGYEFNTTDTGTGNVDYEGSQVPTTINNTFYSIPVKLGTRYNFFSNDSIRVGMGLSGGLWVTSASIGVEEKIENESINSKLELSGLGYTGNLATYLDWILTKKLFFTLNLSYEYSKCSNVNIDNSSGWFAANYPKNSRLLLLEEDGSTRPFNFLVSGPNLSLGFKGVF